MKKDSVRGIYYSLHIIWDGLEVEQRNLSKLVQFREENKDLPVIHHISPRYVTDSMSRYKIKDTLEKVFRKGDEVGIYLSGWRNN